MGPHGPPRCFWQPGGRGELAEKSGGPWGPGGETHGAPWASIYLFFIVSGFYIFDFITYEHSLTQKKQSVTHINSQLHIQTVTYTDKRSLTQKRRPLIFSIHVIKVYICDKSLFI